MLGNRSQEIIIMKKFIREKKTKKKKKRIHFEMGMLKGNNK